MSKNHLKGIGSSGYVTIDTVDDAQPRDGDFSITCWVKITPYMFGGSVTSDFLVWYSAAAETAYCQFRIRGDTGSAELYISPPPFSEQREVYGDVRVTDGTWHFLAATCDRDSATGLKMYVDGVEDSANGDKNPTDFQGDINGGTVYICEMFLSSPVEARLIGGQMDQFRFYKTVLTLEQIRAIYHDGHGVSVNESAFAAIADGWYSEIDDGTGSVLSGRVCSSGVWSDSDGTINGSPGAITWLADGIPIGGISATAVTDLYYTEDY